MPHLLIAGPVHQAGLDLVQSAPGITYDYVPTLFYDEYAALIEKADGLVVRTQPVRADTIARAPRLKIVSRHGVGYDAVDVHALNQRAIPLTIVGDVSSRAVAEHAIMLIVTLAKKMRTYDHAVRSGEWTARNRFDSIELQGKTLLIVGLGRIGRHVLSIAQGFGLRVIVYSPSLTVEDAASLGVERVSELDEALRRADFITLHAPKTGNHPLIGAAQLACMKPTAILVNTARGGLIDEDALAHALATKALAGAGLDVFAEEPPVTTHPLFGRDDVILTPHTASLTTESSIRMAVISIQNALDCFEGRLNPALVVNRVALGL